MTKFFYLFFTCSLFFKISNAQVTLTSDASAKTHAVESSSQITPVIAAPVIKKTEFNRGNTPVMHARENVPSTNLVQCNAYAITGFATSGAFRAPNSRFMSGRLAYIVTAAEMTAANLANGQQVTGIGWLNTIAPGITATGNLKLYLQNSTDLVYTKSTDWATAITGMTTAHDGAFTIPNALDYNLTSFTGGAPFTYTGNAVYVAFEWTYCSGPLSTTQSVGCNNLAVGGANGSSSLQNAASCTPGTTLVSSAFRPITRFFSDCHTNDIKVNALHSMGKLALGHSTNHAVSAYVSNNGTDPVNNIPVTLTVTGVNTFTNTQTVASLAPGQGTLITFPPYTPNAVGNNDVTVSVPADDVISNNSKSVAQVVSLEEIGFKDVNDVSVFGAGFAGSTGIIASRLSTATGGILKSVRVGFSSANGSTYRIAIYGDNNGVPSNTALYTDAANRTVTAAGEVVLTLSPAPNIPAGNFYVAVQQLSTISMLLRYTDEVPLRAGVFFANSVDLSSGWVDNSATLSFRFNVDAMFFPYTITTSAGTGGTISPSGTIGADNNGSQAFTITPDPCYNIADVLADGVSVGAVNTYTFNNITANHTISASFIISPATLPAPVVSGFTNVCAYIGNSTQITYTANSAGATNYTWVLPPNVNIISGQGTANLVVTFNSGFNLQANKQLRVTASSPCGTSPMTIYYLLAQQPNTPGPITGPTDVCPLLGGPAQGTYTITKAPGALGYIWTAQAGTTTITHLYTGANDTVITVLFAPGFTTSSITVQAINGCNPSGVRSLLVNRTTPSTPGLISGPTNACEFIAPNGVAATYSVAQTAGMSYTWTVPAGSTGLTGQGTNTISFIYPAGFTTGSVSVTATNSCGTGPARTLNVTVLSPSTPGVIAVINTVSCADSLPERVYTYSLPAMPANTTSILWTVPTAQGAVLVSGQGTTSITVSYPATAVNGAVTAQAVNNCGSSVIRTVNVNLPACPPDFASGLVSPEVLTKEIAGPFDVQSYPNPAIGEFNLQLNTTDRSTLVAIRILDIQGRELKRMNVRAALQIKLGNDLKPGAYLIEVKQGSNRKVLRAVKL